ncbi:MAG: zinc metallopeptidase [Erysipelotrichaceae bacterium]|nr:zinc metallopeptidase [Erysipelotrichaceae bacterium]
MDIILYFAAAAIVLVSQLWVKSAYAKYSEIPTERNYTGAQVARMILERNGLYDVKVQQVSGSLSDHYNPKNRTVNLSAEVYNGTSVAAVSISSHECGHAIQHATQYAGIKARDAILPVAQISSTLGWTVLMIGLFMGVGSATGGVLFTIGLVMLLVIVAFQVITLPVEFNASSRALRILDEYGIVDEDESSMAKSMLTAAALTYVASLASTVLNVVRILAATNRRR